MKTTIRGGLAVGTALMAVVLAFGAMAQSSGDTGVRQQGGEQVLRERPQRRELRMQVNFALPSLQTGFPDPSRLAAQQADLRRAAYQMAFRECEAIVETVADECRLENLTVNAPPNFNMIVPPQVTAAATYMIVPKR